MLDSVIFGGKERVAILLANQLARMGYESHLIATRSEGPQRPLISDQVRFFCADRTARWDLQGLNRVRDYLRQNEIELVHTHDRGSAYILRLLSLFGSSPLHVVHDHDGPGLGDRRFMLLDALMLRGADAGIAVSDGLRDQLARALRLPPKRCLYMPNGVEIRPPVPPFQGPPTVVHVGNLRLPKDHPNAVRAAALLREKFPELRWICIGRIGDPPLEYLEETQRLIRDLGLEDCFELAGPSDRVGERLEQAHVGVLSSRVEGLPIVLLEYMAAQLPVVVTDVGQCREVVEAAQAGSVVPPRDPEALAASIAAYLDDPVRAREVGARGRSYAVEHMSQEAQGRRAEALYRDLLAERDGTAR